jgi:hypothetical protein
MEENVVAKRFVTKEACGRRKQKGGEAEEYRGEFCQDGRGHLDWTVNFSVTPLTNRDGHCEIII